MVLFYSSGATKKGGGGGGGISLLVFLFHLHWVWGQYWLRGTLRTWWSINNFKKNHLGRRPAIKHAMAGLTCIISGNAFPSSPPNYVSERFILRRL